MLRRSRDRDTFGDNLGAKTFVAVGETTSSTTTYTDSTVTPLTRYIYRIKARNAGGLSEQSGYITARTAARPANRSATGAPTISGTARVGETLTAATSAIADPDGLTNVTYTYQWLADDTTISSATSATHTLASAELNKTIKVQVSFTDDAGNAETLTSAGVGPVAQQANRPATGAPTISGTARVGQTLTAATSAITDPDGLTNVTYTYQWLADDTTISGATSATHTLASAELNKTIKVQVSFTDDNGNTETLTSAGAGPVDHQISEHQSGEEPTSVLVLFSPATGAPTISGTARVGETLTAATSAITDANGLTNVTYTYQWLADDTAISGATSATHTLASAELNKTIKVRVSFTDDAGNAETLTSAGVGPVAQQANRPATGAPTISGTARVGETLTAATSAIADPDGLTNVTYTYQWLADDTAISSATSATYTLVKDDLNKTIGVQVSFTDDNGNTETLTSAGAGPVKKQTGEELGREEEPDSPATGLPTIGPGTQERTLAADVSGIADANGLDNVTYTYQWLADEATISGATGSSYTVTSLNRRTAITVQVSFTDDLGNAETLTSAPFHPYRPHGLNAVLSDGEVTLTWQAPVDFPFLFDYQILRHRPELGDTEPQVYFDSRSTETTFVDSAVAPGVLYVYTVKAGSAWGHLSKAPPPVAIRVPQIENSPTTGVPVIGPATQGGRTLEVDVSGIVDHYELDDVSFTYQWLVDDAEMEGATGSSYTVTSPDRHKAIGVRVSFTDDGNTQTLTSAPFYLSRPNHLTATISAGAVTLAWQAPVEFRFLFDYQILRFRPEMGETEPQVLFDTRTTDTTYVDTDVAPGVQYVYTVKAGSWAYTSHASLPVQIRFPGNANRPAMGAPVITGSVAAGQTLAVDVSGIADADGLDDVTFTYQWLADGADLEGATGDTYTLTESDTAATITVRVSFADNAGNAEAVTSRPLLTAGVHDVPESHDGETPFTFELRFSEEPSLDFSYRTLRDHAFTVTGGKVIMAKRMERPHNGKNKNVRWAITVDPDTSGPVTIVLPATGDCDDSGAICTDDGRVFSTRLEVVVRPAD